MQRLSVSYHKYICEDRFVLDAPLDCKQRRLKADRLDISRKGDNYIVKDKIQRFIKEEDAAQAQSEVI